MYTHVTDRFGETGVIEFRELLRDTLPALSDHLDDLQVDPAYVSQWFLSFFAVTCPLPMLFRKYFCKTPLYPANAQLTVDQESTM